VLEVEAGLEVLQEAEVVPAVVLVHLLVVFLLELLSWVVLVLVLVVQPDLVVDRVSVVVEDDQVPHPSYVASLLLQSGSVAQRGSDPSPKEQLEVPIEEVVDSAVMEATDGYSLLLLQVLRRCKQVLH
jgi:hypothetical protein